jgi:hypothetical protein
MIFVIHTLFAASLVWLVFHYWRQLPLQEDQTAEKRARALFQWWIKGAALPILLWFFLNLGLSRWLPPFLSEVDHLKTRAAITGQSWLWPAIRVGSGAISVIVSYWAALTLLVLAWAIRTQTHDRARFRETTLLWTVFLSPLCAGLLWLGGWAALGCAVVLWLVPVIHGTLPGLIQVKRAPSYSQAIGKLKFGKYSEAEWDIIRELETCESDFNGWMMLAELYAVHFHDFNLAEQTVIDLCEQPDITPSNACVALHRLADWYLELQQDPVGARRCLAAITTRYPNTHLDRMARLRRNSLPHTREEWIEAHRNKPVHLPALHDELESPETTESVNVAAVQQSAERLSQKLARDPNDASAREEFARALAKLDKWRPAIDQLDLLLALDGQPILQRAEWTGLKADWLMRLDPESPSVRGVLEHLVDAFPDTPQAMAAQRRLLLLKERSRVAKYAHEKKKPRIVIRLDEAEKPDGSRET